MPPPELDVRASLFGLLSTRRDIDNLTLELLGRYNVDRLTGSLMPDDTDRLDFNLVCQLEFIFDLQRTHLQSRTPFNSLGSSGLTERLPYLLSLQTAKGAFELLSQLSKDFFSRFGGGGQDIEISSRCNVFIRALVSATRMLCLHPCVRPGEMIKTTPADQPHSWEQVLTWVCDSALNRVPKRHPGLQLPRMGRKMVPIDDSRLMNVVNECAIDFIHDSSYKYWTLYDISCSVVAAYTQHRSTIDDAASEDALFDGFPGEEMTSMDDVNEAARLLGDLAAKIADSVISEARRVWLSRGGDRYAVLLMDIVEVLNPILAVHPSPSCRGGYEEFLGITRYRDHNSIYQALDTHRISALEGFQKILKQRELVLRDTNEELPALLSKIERVCSDIANTHIGPLSRHVGYLQDESHHAESYKHIGPASPLAFPEDGSRSIETLRLYAANCPSAHLIADGPNISVMKRDAEEQQSSWKNGSLYFPEGTICPFCPDHAPPFNQLREISPLTQVLGVVNQKWQDLDDLRRHRQRSFMQGSPTSPRAAPGFGMPTPRIDLDIGVQQQYATASRSSGYRSTFSLDPPIPDYPTDEQFPEATPYEESSKSISGESSRWNLFKIKRMRTKKGSAETIPSTPTRNALHYLLQGGEVNVSLSTDSRHLILWTSKSLGLYDVSTKGEIRELVVMPSPVRDPDIVLLSKSYCVIVQKGRNNDEMRFHSLTAQFNYLFVYTSPEPMQCLALSPDDYYLAVGLTNGVVQLLRLNQQTGGITGSILSLRASPPVAALSFSADANQLAVCVRDGKKVNAYLSFRPFAERNGPYIDEAIGVRQDDDQGVSSVVCCPERRLLCITYWTVSGVPVLFDRAAKRAQRLNKSTTGLDIGTRIQQAAFSRSGSILILVNNAGTIFKINIDDIDHIRAETLAKSRWLSRAAGNSKLLDLGFSEDERSLKVVWTKDSNVSAADYDLVP